MNPWWHDYFHRGGGALRMLQKKIWKFWCGEISVEGTITSFLSQNPGLGVGVDGLSITFLFPINFFFGIGQDL